MNWQFPADGSLWPIQRRDIDSDENILASDIEGDELAAGLLSHDAFEVICAGDCLTVNAQHDIPKS